MRVSTVPLSLKCFCKELMLELSDSYDVVAVASSGPELDDIASDGIRVAAVDMERRIAPLSDLRSLVSLVKVMRREKPHIVHTLTPKAGLLGMMAARLAGVPVRIHTFTGLLFPTAKGIRRLLLKTTDRLTCLCATHILSEGKGVMADLKAAAITRKPIRILGNGNIRGIDPRDYAITDDVRRRAALLRHSFGIPDTDFVCLFVGRIVGDKGIDQLVAAFLDVLKTHPSTSLMIAGDYEESDPVGQAARDIIASHPKIHLSDGWVSDLLPWYAAADALVFPSYREGFPNVVLEAGITSLPSVVTDINGSREIIADGKNGYVVPVRDAKALAGAMSRLVAAPAAAARMGRAARLNIIEKYDAAHLRQCHRELYRELLPD